MDDARMETLLAAVREGEVWLARFNGRHYREAFAEYAERFGPPYREAVRAAGAEGLPALAERLLDGLEAGWKRQRPWNRSVVRTTEKQTVVDYLSPMLLGQEEPGCGELCALLRDGWAARWPKDAYRTATYEQIRGGFRTSILGIPLPDRGRED